jgi:hypothetical protein
MLDWSPKGCSLHSAALLGVPHCIDCQV